MIWKVKENGRPYKEDAKERGKTEAMAITRNESRKKKLRKRRKENAIKIEGHTERKELKML